jgi:hypothetical protein
MTMGVPRRIRLIHCVEPMLARNAHFSRGGMCTRMMSESVTVVEAGSGTAWGGRVVAAHVSGVKFNAGDGQTK